MQAQGLLTLHSGQDKTERRLRWRGARIMRDGGREAGGRWGAVRNSVYGDDSYGWCDRSS